MSDSQTSTHQKALALNLDHERYGTIAEIGAGQEVSRWFFQVGGAAGTIAKTISAYDMLVSDQLYGKGTRYVSRDRVLAMLEREFTSLIERLQEKRGKDTAFFAFADTVSARNYAGTNECHGWLGLRYQPTPGAAAEDVLIHVNMHDASNQLQQEALGILGVNLIHGTLYRRDWHKDFIPSLLDNIAPGRLEVDAVYTTAPSAPEPIELGLRLVEHGLCEAVLFEKSGELVPPTEAFHNRPILLLRTSAERPRNELFTTLLREGSAQLARESGEKAKPPLAILEVNAAKHSSEPLDVSAIRAKLLEALGIGEHVLVTSFEENYRLTHYLKRYSPEEPIRFVIGASSLVLMFEQRYYENISGRVLEGLGRLFADNIKVYVKPMVRQDFDSAIIAAALQAPTFRAAESEMIGIENLRFMPPLDHLFQYLCSIEVLVELS